PTRPARPWPATGSPAARTPPPYGPRTAACTAERFPGRPGVPAVTTRPNRCAVSTPRCTDLLTYPHRTIPTPRKPILGTAPRPIPRPVARPVERGTHERADRDARVPGRGPP